MLIVARIYNDFVFPAKNAAFAARNEDVRKFTRDGEHLALGQHSPPAMIAIVMMMMVVATPLANFFALMRVEHDEHSDAKRRHPHYNQRWMVQKNLFHGSE